MKTMYSASGSELSNTKFLYKKDIEEGKSVDPAKEVAEETPKGEVEKTAEDVKEKVETIMVEVPKDPQERIETFKKEIKKAEFEMYENTVKTTIFPIIEKIEFVFYNSENTKDFDNIKAILKKLKEHLLTFGKTHLLRDVGSYYLTELAKDHQRSIGVDPRPREEDYRRYEKEFIKYVNEELCDYEDAIKILNSFLTKKHYLERDDY